MYMCTCKRSVLGSISTCTCTCVLVTIEECRSTGIHGTYLINAWVSTGSHVKRVGGYRKSHETMGGARAINPAAHKELANCFHR